MPPIRRTSPNPQPKGRRPKIAGTESPRRAADPSADRKPVEPRSVETPKPVEPRSVETPKPVDLSKPGAEATSVAEAVPAPEVVAAQATGAAETGAGEAGTGEAGAGETAAGETGAGEAGAGKNGAEEAGARDAAEELAPAPARPVNRTSALRPRARIDVFEEADGRGGRVGVNGWRAVVVVGAVAFALALFAVVAAVKPGADVPNRAWVDTADTTQAAAAARTAIETLYTYKYDTVDEDFDRARAVLTDDMRAKFDETAQVTRDAVVQTKTETNAEVTDIGVKLLDGSHAELVGSMNVSASNDGVAQGSAEGPLSVTMAKVGDTWLLSDIRDR
ncbi:hypothetical protein ACFYVR_11665 [Rhodococcus sp. NPDC003318]|uniref:hypothetical protein n=1 Tax=Rhodococcus sp. NPDC003318 TaxID=3364503 RepID=UPI0036A38116